MNAFDDLVGRAARGARARLIGILPTRDRAPAELGFVASDTDDGRHRELHGRGIAPDRVARGTHVIAAFAEVRDRRERHVEFGGEPSREPGRSLRPPSAHDDRRSGPLHGFRQCRRVDDRVVLPRERVVLTGGRVPQTGDDLELFLEHLEAFSGRGERDRVRGVLGVVPPGADPELDASAAHGVGLRDLDRERSGKPKRDRRDECAEPDARGLAADRGEGHPRVGRTGSGRSLADPLVVIGTEEGVEAEPLRTLRHREQLVVGRALLRLGEDA